MSSKELKGVIPALITPMKQDGSIDFGAMERQVDFLVSAGVNGFFVNGTTAEGPILTRSERIDAVRLVAGICGKRQFVCAACIAPSTDQVMEEIRQIEPLGPDYIVCVAPFYFTVSQEVILKHYERICQSTRIPVIFYDIPQHTHNPITLSTRLTLVRLGIGAGFKDSTGDFATFSRSVLESGDERFSWIQGDDLLDSYSVEIGAKGVVTGLSNISPAPYLELFRLAERGDHTGMLNVQKRINAIARVITATGGRVIPAIKAAVSLLGRCGPTLRFAELSATEAETEAIREIVESLPDTRS